MSREAKRSVTELPDEIRDFLLDPDAVDQVDAIVAKHGLSASAKTVLFDVAEKVILGWYAVIDLPSLLVVRLENVDFSLARRVAVDLTGYRLLPLVAWLGDVEGAIRAWGGDPAAFAHLPRVEIEMFNPPAIVKRVLQEADWRISDLALQDRLEYILTSFVDRMRPAEETRDMLTRSAKVGGLELEAEVADRLVALFQDKVVERDASFPNPERKTPPSPPLVRGGTRLATVDETDDLALQPTVPTADETSSAGPPLGPSFVRRGNTPTVSPPQQELRQTPPNLPSAKTPATSPTPSLVRRGIRSETRVPLIQGGLQGVAVEDPLGPVSDLLDEPEKADLARAAEAMKNVEAVPGLSSLQKAVWAVMTELHLPFSDDAARQQFATLVEARFHGRKDAYALRAQLETAVDRGGFGLTGRELVRVLEAVERAFDGWTRGIRERAREGKDAFVAGRQRRDAERALVARKEETVLAQRYATLTGKAPRERLPAIDVPPPARVSAAVSPQEALDRRKERIDSDKLRAAVEAVRPPAVQPAPVRLSPESVPSAPAGRPTMEDVTFVRTLAGPVEEIGQLSLVAFRRLSRDPHEAALKVKDKIDLLADQRYEKRIEGINAWRQSPVNRLYLALSQAALMSGRSVEAVSDERHVRGEETLTPAELKALVMLNADLRF